MNEVLASFGPTYPNLGAGVQKFRRMANAAGSSAALDPAVRRAYGQAVEDAIRSLQRQALKRTIASVSAQRASGTFHNTADAIEKAVRAQNLAKFRAACERDRHDRTDERVQELYDEAMQAKAVAAFPWTAP